MSMAKLFTETLQSLLTTIREFNTIVDVTFALAEEIDPEFCSDLVGSDELIFEFSDRSRVRISGSTLH